MDDINKWKTLHDIEILLSNRSNWIPGIVLSFFLDYSLFANNDFDGAISVDTSGIMI